MGLTGYTTFRGSRITMDRVRSLLRRRYAGDAESAGIAIAAAEETDADTGALEELAMAWYITRRREADAAAALSGAIAASARRLSDAEIAEATGMPLASIHALTAEP
jgi:hypothetical protein